MRGAQCAPLAWIGLINRAAPERSYSIEAQFGSDHKELSWAWETLRIGRLTLNPGWKEKSERKQKEKKQNQKKASD